MKRVKMKKYYKTTHYQSNDGNFNIFINWYTTKSGYLKFNIEIYAEHLHNNLGFCSCIANYNTKDNTMLQFLRRNDYFYLVEEV
jgi:hypothetical protein